MFAISKGVWLSITVTVTQIIFQIGARQRPVTRIGARGTARGPRNFGLQRTKARLQSPATTHDFAADLDGHEDRTRPLAPIHRGRRAIRDRRLDVSTRHSD